MAYTLDQLQGMTKNKNAISTFDPIGSSLLSNALKGTAGSVQALQNYDSPRDMQFDYSGVQTPNGVSQGVRGGSPYTSLERQRIRALQAQKRASEQGISTQYNNYRASLGGQAQQSASNIAEYLSQRGLSQSGTGVQSAINNQGFLMTGLTGLEQQRSQAMADLETQYQQGLAQAQAEAEAQRKLDEQAKLQSEIDTIGAYGQDYQAEINRRMAINPNDPVIKYLQAARVQKIGGIAEAEAKQKQQDFENQLDLMRIQNARGVGGGGGGDTTDTFSDTIIRDSLLTKTVNEDTFAETTALRPDAYYILQNLVANGMSPQKANAFIALYNIPIPKLPDNGTDFTGSFTPGSYVPLKGFK